MQLAWWHDVLVWGQLCQSDHVSKATCECRCTLKCTTVSSVESCCTGDSGVDSCVCVCFILGSSNVRVKSPGLVDGHVRPLCTRCVHSDICRVAECSWTRSDVCPYATDFHVLGCTWLFVCRQREAVAISQTAEDSAGCNHEAPGVDVLLRHGLGHHLVGCITPSAQCASRLLALLAAFSGTQSLIPDIDCSGGGHTSACNNFAHKPWKCESVYS